MHGPRPRVLLFDLGGVLADFRGIDALASIPSEVRRTKQEVWDLWLASPTVRAFETGQLAPRPFVEQLTAELSLRMSSDELLRELATWVPHLLPGAEDLLAHLGGSFRLALLSNTNDLHWPRFEPQLAPYFEATYLSYRTGRLKPDAETFHACTEDLGVRPEEILFFDDSATNVEAARRAGLCATVVRGPSDCRTVLADRGWLAGSSAEPSGAPG